MRIATRNFQTRPIIDAATLRRLVEFALEAAGGSTDAVSFVFVDDVEMRANHARFLGSDETTDVLAFPSGAVDSNGEHDAGDVIVCTDQAARQAAAHGHGYPGELVVLALHGFLHLVGYDHTRDSGEMRRLERRLRPKVLHAQRCGSGRRRAA